MGKTRCFLFTLHHNKLNAIYRMMNLYIGISRLLIGMKHEPLPLADARLRLYFTYLFSGIYHRTRTCISSLTIYHYSQYP